MPAAKVDLSRSWMWVNSCSSEAELSHQSPFRGYFRADWHGSRNLLPPPAISTRTLRLDADSFRNANDYEDVGNWCVYRYYHCVRPHPYPEVLRSTTRGLPQTLTFSTHGSLAGLPSEGVLGCIVSSAGQPVLTQLEGLSGIRCRRVASWQGRELCADSAATTSVQAW